MGNIQSSAYGEPTPPSSVQAFPPTHPTDAAKQSLKRQVFISHTGQDEDAKTFAASILKPAMEAAGLAVYMDFSSLQLGSSWREELVDNAANSMVVVVVLSRSFTKQFWCMLELDLALNAHQQVQVGAKKSRRPLVLPVFYDSVDVIVDPGKILQRWSGNLQDRLQKVEDLGREWAATVDLDRWVNNICTLKEKVQHVRKRLPGQASAKDDCWQLARGVVRAAARHVPNLVAVGNVVGFEEQEAALAAELGGRLGLWLHGQGGRGKSTMAKLLYNRLQHAGGFSNSAFVEIQVNDGADKTAQHLASALKGFGATADALEGAPVLSQRLQRFVEDKKLLYILDNVWTARQLTALLPTRWGEGSVVIVTTRFESFTDSDIWPQLDKQLHHAMVEVLDMVKSRQLFRQSAGLRGNLEAALQDVETAILAACSGLPLALRLMGGQLYNSKEEAAWKGALAALQHGNPGGGSEGALEGVLTHSLAGLSERHVSMFLDVATILRGERLEEVRAVWKAWHGEAAATYHADLVRRSLLGTDEEGRLAIHDVLVSMGRGIILQRKPGLEEHFGSRVWIQDGKVVGLDQAQCRRVLAAQVHGGETREDELQQLISGLDLSAVRILQLRGWQVPPKKELLWLEKPAVAPEWWQLSPGLVALVAHHTLGDHPWERMTALVTLGLSWGCMDALPESFGCLAALQKLTLSWCEKLTALPESFGQLAALQTLDLGYCKLLTALPESFGRLAALHTLDLSWCKQLKALPKSFGQLAALQTLKLCGCYQLTALPQSFGQLPALHTLDLSGCLQIAALPESFVHLAALQTLILTCCNQLTALPESFGRLAALHTLDLGYCHLLMALPGSFGQLPALQALKLHSCYQLTALPESFGQLAALHTLDLSWCVQLTALPESFVQLATLQKLNLESCDQLTALPESFGQLAALQELNLCSRNQLTALPESFGQLAALQTLDLSDCKQLKALPRSFGQLAALKTLELRECSALTDLPVLMGLTWLDIRGCVSLEAIPPLTHLPGLHVNMDDLHRYLGSGCVSGYFGEQPGQGERRHVWAAAPEGCWISQWRVTLGGGGRAGSIQGVLNDGTPLDHWMDDCGEGIVVGVAGGSFTAVHGRAGPEGLLAFMDCGDLEGGEAWIFTCPPGHRIVGYSTVLLENDTDDDEDYCDESGSVETDTGDNDDHSDELNDELNVVETDTGDDSDYSNVLGFVEDSIDDDEDHSVDWLPASIVCIRFITAIV